MRANGLLFASIFVLLAAPLLARQTDVRITLVNGSAEEQRAQEQLERLLATYDIGAWIFTREIRIESGVIPHSHPVLTLDTGSLDNDDGALGGFLHEQLHWYANELGDVTDAVTEEFAEIFPDAPAGPGEGGARNRDSTYLHLMVCDLELQALTELLGEARARAILEGYRHYAWIYDQVLHNPVVRRVNERHGAVVPPLS